MINHVKKIWGSEDWLINNEKYCAKFLNLDKGYECSLHYHCLKDEVFYVLAGEVELYYIDLMKNLREDLKHIILNGEVSSIFVPEENLNKIIIKQSQQFRVRQHVAHKFRSLTFASKILEVSTTHSDNDSYRIVPAKEL